MVQSNKKTYAKKLINEIVNKIKEIDEKNKIILSIAGSDNTSGAFCKLI